ncbi:hypothetical protein MAM1_0162d06970 [Mucor ambiguus]|uniref:Uncharacterized protein n=1 Tax=Mucor ambiguus TaxID=91626 RepID=A0A0C9MYW4_9FUNG|nr:hypothetical protein MAM1_0162d06970 [Mucor ambiguus]
MLLQESQRVLQNHLVHALTENMPRKQRISLDNQQDNLMPIVSSTAASSSSQIQSSTAAAPEQQQHGYEIMQCRGWIMNRRVWLQATCHALYVLYVSRYASRLYLTFILYASSQTHQHTARTSLLLTQQMPA